MIVFYKFLRGSVSVLNLSALFNLLMKGKIWFLNLFLLLFWSLERLFSLCLMLWMI